MTALRDPLGQAATGYTDEQLRCIEHLGGHSLTFAVPGSGKTHTLVGRVLFLLEQGVPANRIRVLAFNVNAKDEFKRRLGNALPAHTDAPQVATFHSLGKRITELFEKQGLLPRQRLETNDWVEKKLARDAVATAVQELGIDETPGPDEQDAFVSFIGLVKSDILSATDAFTAFDIPKSLDYFTRAFAHFERARRRAGLRFYADLLADPVALMTADPRALALVTNKLDVLCVDEFQDVSRIQVELLRQLLGTRGTLNAVGDDSQAIYAWRGSRPELMGAEFDRYFPGATRFTLSRTFRFGHRIALAAAQLIAHNRNRMDTLCVSAPGTPDSRIGVIHTTSSGDQSEVVATIERWQRSGRSLRACAVVARLWAQTLGIELALLEREVPYYKPKEDFFSVPEVAGLLGVLRLAAGTLFAEPRAPEIVRHLLATPTLWLTSQRLTDLAEAIVAAPADAPRQIAAVARQLHKPYMAEKVIARAELWQEVLTWGDLSAVEALRLYASRTDLLSTFGRSATADTAAEKEVAFHTLLEWAVRTRATVRQFVDRMDQLRRSRARYEAGGDAVLLATIHQVKGLEYPLVVVTGLEEGRFPSVRSNLEEERRLAFVALTRAQEQLWLVVPPDAHFAAQFHGTAERGPGRAKTAVSPFVLEANLRTSIDLGSAIEARLHGADANAALPQIPRQSAALLNRYLGELGVAERYATTPAPAPTADERHWALDDRVRHATFGPGRVVGFVDRDILDIDFGGIRRSIKPSMAPMERV